METEVPTVTKETVLRDMMDLLTERTNVPVAVVEDEKLKGIVVRGTVVAALSGSEVKLNGTSS